MDKLTASGQPLIQVSDFEGPLDLLLHLIKTNEMDIYDIQISTITAQYLDYLHQMQTLRLDVAGEYFVMAATLMAIKAKLLLPKPQTVAPVDDEDLSDPREDLVNQLLDYQRYQQAAALLKERAQQRAQHFTRAAMTVPADTKLTVAPGVTVTDLQTALVKLVHRATVSQPVTTHVASEQYTIKDQMQVVLHRLTHRPVAFDQLFTAAPSLEEVVTTFLAVLELTRQHRVAVHQASRLVPLEINTLSKEEEAHDANRAS